MIQELHIENLAVREDATLEFTANDVALVGETGAGKSLVVSSLLLLLPFSFSCFIDLFCIP